MFEIWNKFKLGDWCSHINVEEFIKLNYQSYDGNENFLVGPSEKTLKLLTKFKELLALEKEKNGVLNMDTEIVASITSHQPGYLIKDLEEIVGLQTDEPLKRALHVYGGIRTAVNACEEYHYHVNKNIEYIFENYRKTHNQGVFDVYTEEMRAARRNGIITGLPDMYGRGRIIGDYRRVALYGVDFLIKEKENEKHNLVGDMSEDLIRSREENTEQINALNQLKEMALSYGYDISKPATNAKEAIQWLYFGYLGAVKEQNGAAMSLGRTSNFIDIYLEKDIEEGKLNEIQAQELIDQFVLKLRMVRFARISAYNELFTGDPVWVTEVIGGAMSNGKHLVTKTSYRFLHTLYNLDHAPEPNLTILWSKHLPENFKKYCAKVSIDTSSIQYENDDLMRPNYGEDYAISCCVSPMRVGKEMQFFGARANLAKALLYSINGGTDEISKERVTDKLKPITSSILKYDEVMASFDITLDWLADIYVNALNIIHYMHDKYCYERLEMALHDGEVKRNFATGLAGLSVVADSLSAIKYETVEVVRENDLVVDFIVTGDFPKYGNNDDRVDNIASELVTKFMNKLRKKKTYRNSVPTLSILTITSNVVYGQKTGNTPDGRRAYSPFAPGANPMMKRDTNGALASLLSVAKLPFADAQDGISNTFNLLPEALGKSENKEEQINNLVSVLEGYFLEKGFHLNVNILDRSVLVDAMHHPEKYPDLTIRVSGYAVKFNNLTKIQQLDVLSRTYHDKR